MDKCLHIPLVDSIKKNIHALPSISPECCIYRVPRRIRERNPKAYTPQIVSVGPLHHGEKELVGLEEFKLRCLKAFLGHTLIPLDDFVSMIKEWELTVRDCYAERFDKLNSESFVNMILLDCCFIIEVFWKIGYDVDQAIEPGGVILLDLLSDRRLITQVISDIILLENQLPFFIIERLFNLAFHSNPGHDLPSFCQLSVSFIRAYFPIGDNSLDISNTPVKHFVDLLRVCFIPPNPQRSTVREEDFYFSKMPRATEMQEAGMIISKSSNHRLLDITYRNGRLQVPRLIVEDRTEALFRNLVALEVCHYFPDTYIIDYLVFMDRLIDSAQDVELLIKSGVIYSLIDDNSTVATLFNNLCTGATCGSYYYRGICEDVNKYCDALKHIWQATLKRDYFSTPWRSASTVAAIILLVLTFIQTIKAFF